VLNELHGAALKVGPHATGIVEPRQARKGATVRRPSRVPWEYLAGAGSGERSQYGPFEGGCTVIVNGARGRLGSRVASERYVWLRSSSQTLSGQGGSARRVNP
jgi:hypothetical protein